MANVPPSQQCHRKRTLPLQPTRFRLFLCSCSWGTWQGPPGIRSVFTRQPTHGSAACGAVLASSTVLGCAAFAAVSGSSVATAVTIGKVALPEMKRFGYANGLATGSVAAGGTLGILIPPSTGFVLYAILTEESIGRLFIAGILPGILLSLLFVAVIMIVTQLKPSEGPAGPKSTGSEKLWATLRSLPLIGVILVSIGGIYLGVFTPVEAAGVGATLVSVMASGNRRRSDFQAARYPSRNRYR